MKINVFLCICYQNKNLSKKNVVTHNTVFFNGIKTEKTTWCLENNFTFLPFRHWCCFFFLRFKFWNIDFSLESHFLKVWRVLILKCVSIAKIFIILANCITFDYFRYMIYVCMIGMSADLAKCWCRGEWANRLI
jgi:hypothetical protein